MGKIAAPTVLRHTDEEGFRKALNDLLKEKKDKAPSKTTCPTCGAPIHGKQCEYCGNYINFL